jgi:hypothetical protein
MRVRSTGLGKTEMILRQEKIAVKNGYLMMSLRSTQPASWHIRILMDRNDVGRFLLSIIKGTIFIWLFSFFKKLRPPPSEY